MLCMCVLPGRWLCVYILVGKGTFQQLTDTILQPPAVCT